MTSIVWNDEYNEGYTGEVTVSPSSGNGNARVFISGSPNEGLDRSGTITASGSGISREMSVVNEGRRHVFMTGDGLPFRTSDGSTYNTIKKTDIGVRGVIGLYSAKGLDNKRMAANPVWRDESGLENHLQMKNFLWRMGSGCGLYEFNFNIFGSNGGTKSSTDSIMTFNIPANNNFCNAYSPLYEVGYMFDFNVHIEGLVPGVTVAFLILGTDQKVDIPTNGIYNIKLTVKEGAIQNRLYIWFYNTLNKAASVKITQIPDYSGAIVFDGVDDYGICETFPILTKEKGYMVMALRKYITDPVVKVSSGLASKNVSPNYGAFCFEFSDAGLLNTRSFGKLTRLAQFPDLITWQCSENFNDIDILSGDVLDTGQLSVGRHSNNYANVALYSLVIIDHDTTEEERQLVVDYWKKEFPELQITQS